MSKIYHLKRHMFLSMLYGSCSSKQLIREILSIRNPGRQNPWVLKQLFTNACIYEVRLYETFPYEQVGFANSPNLKACRCRAVLFSDISSPSFGSSDLQNLRIWDTRAGPDPPALDLPDLPRPSPDSILGPFFGHLKLDLAL